VSISREDGSYKGMYTREELLSKIRSRSHINAEKLKTCLRMWHIDPIYEDENENEYFDDFAVHRLNHGVMLRELGRDDKEISAIINNDLAIQSNISNCTLPMVKRVSLKDNNFDASNLNKFTMDIASQTLSILAESIVSKISDEITDKFRENTFFQPVIESTKIKKDNEILSSQVEKLLEDNKKLIARNNLLQKENARFKHMFGNWYTKQQ